MNKTHIEQRIANEKITNVRLLPLQSRNEYHSIIQSSDINLISLDDRMKAPCLPGKTINLLAVRKPLIAIVNRDSETASVLNAIDPDIVVEPRHPDELRKIILKIKNNPDFGNLLAEKGEKIFKGNMTLEKSVHQYLDIFDKLITKSRSFLR